jgi:uracil-DNA glycosylase
MAEDAQRQLRAYVEYFRDLGVYDFYRRGEPGTLAWHEALPEARPDAFAAVEPGVVEAGHAATPSVVEHTSAASTVVSPALAEREIAAERKAAVDAPLRPDSAGGGFGVAVKLVSFDDLAPLPGSRIAVEQRAAALKAIQDEIGDCTRCPLAYAGRRKIVFGDGDPAARLMFVGEGPGADEDATGVPFVGKAGQLLNNMINAMGLKREEVYIANIVKCRPPANRVPEPVEANTCSQFLLRQMDVVQPQVVVALGATAATYLLGARQSLAGLRGRWHSCRGAKLAVTYHPAFLLRDPTKKGDAWKDLQMVMAELGLKAPAK